MSLVNQTAIRFREVILSGRWIANTNFYDQLKDINFQQATTRIGDLNTIAMLTFHIDYYIAGILQVFDGGTLDIRDKYSYDMPEIKDEQQWEDMKQKLWEDAEKFAQHIEKMTKEQLHGVFVDEKYGNYLRNIDAMIEHSYYHLGQLVLLKKMIK
ncbi:MAG: hypothetical protein RIR48_2036 [Bacteroidota bacterium]|jgi:uncharacterized damage-inducible protein DinB